MNFSPQQNKALSAVSHWFKNEAGQKQVFRLFGFAGTGKTTLAKYFSEDLGEKVKYACYTGKAAHVMASKGCKGATTIHRLIYRPSIASSEHLKKLEKQLKDLLAQRSQPNNDINIKTIERVESEIAKEKENAGRMSFSLNLESDLRQASLLIIDEVSMINETTGKDLESFGVPILVLGDPMQLPPIYGEGYFTEGTPDILLTEIHRQARDNPIIAMSKIVREGGILQLGTYGQSRVISEKLDADDVLSHNIILTGLRKTKKACDDRARKLLDFSSPLPEPGDVVMCVKNNHNLGLLNGQIWNVTHEAAPAPGGLVSLQVKDPDSDNNISVFTSEKLFYGQPLSRWERDEFTEEFEYAYAITVHKAQGSQWNSVLLYDQKDKFSRFSERDKRRWLYTGITRAAEKLTVMRL